MDFLHIALSNLCSVGFLIFIQDFQKKLTCAITFLKKKSSFSCILYYSIVIKQVWIYKHVKITVVFYEKMIFCYWNQKLKEEKLRSEKFTEIL